MLIVSFDDIIGALSEAVADRSLLYHKAHCGQVGRWGGCYDDVMRNFLLGCCNFEGLFTPNTPFLSWKNWLQVVSSD